MKITINAPVITVTPVTTIPSKTGGNGYTKCELILDDSHGEYKDVLAVEFGGEKINLTNGLVTGQMVTVEAFVSSREYNGRYFTSLRGHTVNAQGQPQTQGYGGQQPFPNNFPGQQQPAQQGYYNAPTPGNPPYNPQSYQQGSMFGQ